MATYGHGVNQPHSGLSGSYIYIYIYFGFLGVCVPPARDYTIAADVVSYWRV